jgi:hypothetical protein
MAVNAEERNNSCTGRSRCTTFRIEELHPTLRAEIEGVEDALPTKKQLEEMLQVVAEA